MTKSDKAIAAGTSPTASGQYAICGGTKNKAGPLEGEALIAMRRAFGLNEETGRVEKCFKCFRTIKAPDGALMQLCESCQCSVNAVRISHGLNPLKNFKARL